jgi:hypothetical protein
MSDKKIPDPGSLKADPNAPFWQQLNDPGAPTININGVDIKHCVYNLLVTRRDVRLYVKGIKPHRGWQIGHVKNYFGIRGGKQKIHDQIVHLANELIPTPPTNED